MQKLYCLNFYHRPNGDYREGFHIGLFATYEEAAHVEARYRKEVPGFKDYVCEAEITEVPVIGTCDNLQAVYRFQGWNENEDYDEVDIIDSDCYCSQEQAIAAYEQAQQQFSRQEWVLNRHIIGKCEWQEGFARVTYPPKFV